MARTFLYDSNFNKQLLSIVFFRLSLYFISAELCINFPFLYQNLRKQIVLGIAISNSGCPNELDLKTKFERRKEFKSNK